MEAKPHKNSMLPTPTRIAPTLPPTLPTIVPTTLLFLCTFLTTLLLGYTLYQDGDTHWHLAAGREILQTLSLPHTDNWTFASDQQWYNISWLFDIVIAAIAIPLGDFGLHIATLLCGALLICEILRTLKQWESTTFEARFLAASLSAIALLNYTVLRPQLAACFLALYGLTALQKSRKNPQALLLLPILTIAWVNIHGSFPVLALLLAAHGAEALYQSEWKRFQTLFLVGITCAIATLINPLGFEVYTGMERTLHSALSPLIAEWQGWRAHTTTYHGVSTLIFITGIFGVSTLLRHSTIPLAERIMTFGFTLLSFLSIRHFSFLAVIAPPFVALALTGTKKTWPFKLPFNKLPLAPLVLIGILAIGYTAFLPSDELSKKISSKFTADYMDRESIHIIHQDLPGKKVINEYDLGGALANFGEGKIPYYMDGRAGTAFSEKILIEYIDTLILNKTPLVVILEKYQPEVAMFRNMSMTHRIAGSQLKELGWRIFHQNKKNIIYISPPKKHELDNEKSQHKIKP